MLEKKTFLLNFLKVAVSLYVTLYVIHEQIKIYNVKLKKKIIIDENIGPLR